MKHIIFYDHRSQLMSKKQQYKIKKIIELDCIRPFNDSWLCFPIPGNTRTYNIKANLTGYTCNCQHYVMKKTNCAHIQALREYLTIHNEAQMDMFQKVI